jgi:hypothetical protein
MLVILLLIVLASSGREPADQVQEHEHEQELKRWHRVDSGGQNSQLSALTLSFAKVGVAFPGIQFHPRPFA